MKRCPACKTTLPVEQFSKDKSRADGLNSKCKACMKAYQKSQYYLRGPAWIRALSTNARHRARKAQVPFDSKAVRACLESAPDRCPALGIYLTAGDSLTEDSATLDRKRPELGYVEGNLQVLSNLANRIKSSATPAQVIRMARFMTKV